MGNKPSAIRITQWARRPSQKRNRKYSDRSKEFASGESLKQRGSVDILPKRDENETAQNLKCGNPEIASKSDQKKDGRKKKRKCKELKASSDEKSKIEDDEEEFIAFGIDYLPDFEKKRERRKRNVRKILHVNFNWSANYLQFLERARALRPLGPDLPGMCTSVRRISTTSQVSTAGVPKLSSDTHALSIPSHDDTLPAIITDSKPPPTDDRDSGASSEILESSGRPTTVISSDRDERSTDKPRRSVDRPEVSFVSDSVLTDRLRCNDRSTSTNCYSIDGGRHSSNGTSRSFSRDDKSPSLERAESIESLVDEKGEAEDEAVLRSPFLPRTMTVDSGIDVGTAGTTDWRTYNNYPYENVVMSGGGSKGYAYIGSLKKNKRIDKHNNAVHNVNLPVVFNNIEASNEGPPSKYAAIDIFYHIEASHEVVDRWSSSLRPARKYHIIKEH